MEKHTLKTSTQIQEDIVEKHLEDEMLLDPDNDLNEKTGISSFGFEDIALVFFGGCIGGILRTIAFDLLSKVVALSLVNILGAFLLGYTLESLVASNKSSLSQKRIRLFLGTGCMGAFTTYSTFISHISTLLMAKGYLQVFEISVFLLITGFIFALFGIYLARKLSKKRI